MLGHEVVAEDSAGRRVALVHHLPCGECDRCRAGHETTCERFPEPTIVPGGFAERVRAAATIPLPDGRRRRDRHLRGAARLRASRRRSSAFRGRVLVVGCGFAGLLFVQALVRRGDDVLAPTRCPTGSSSRSATGPSRPTGRSDAAVLCAHAGLDERARGARARRDAARLLLADRAAAARLRGRAPPGADARRLLLGDAGAMRDAIALLPGLDPIPTVTLPLERFAEGLELYPSHEAVKVVFTP